MVTVKFLGHRPPYATGDTAPMDEAEAEALERKGLVELVDDAPAVGGWPFQSEQAREEEGHAGETEHH